MAPAFLKEGRKAERKAKQFSVLFLFRKWLPRGGGEGEEEGGVSWG